MSATRGGVVVGAPPQPQVNLLPPEVRASRTLRTTKRLLGLVVVAVIGVAAAGYVWSAAAVSTANDDLGREQDRTRELLAQQAEYTEVPEVMGRLEAAQTARTLGFSTEVLWAVRMRAFMQVAPLTVAFETIQMSGTTPMAFLVPTTNVLATPGSVGQITFQGRALTMQDIAGWAEQLETIDGFADAYITATPITEATEGAWAGTPYYEVSGTVQILPSAYAARFVEVTEDDDTADEED